MPVNQQKLKKLLSDLNKLKAVQGGGALGGLIYDLTNKLEMLKGDKGDTPQKGVDYFTDKEVSQIVDDMVKQVKRWIPKDGAKGDTGKAGKDGKDGRDGRDGIDGRDGERGLQGINGADGGPDTPEVIKQKLESLEDEDKLSIKAIKDLQEELDKIKKMKGTVQYVGGGGVGKHNVVAYDLSASLNGVLKTFSLPAFWKVISVHSSSFPNAFRPTVDYTTDASASTITFTAEIDASTTLATGQTIIITYSE